jgi:hypothetical protein
MSAQQVAPDARLLGPLDDLADGVVVFWAARLGYTRTEKRRGSGPQRPPVSSSTCAAK